MIYTIKRVQPSSTFVLASLCDMPVVFVFVSFSFGPLQEAVGKVCLKERGRDVLVLRRVTSSVTSPSDRPSPTSSGGVSREDDCNKRFVRLPS